MSRQRRVKSKVMWTRIYFPRVVREHSTIKGIVSSVTVRLDQSNLNSLITL